MSKYTLHNKELIDFRNRLLNFNKGNSLFHLSESSWLNLKDAAENIFAANQTKKIEKFYKKGKSYEKSTGISPWKKTLGIITWWEQKKEEIVNTPIYIKSGSLTRIKGPVTKYSFNETGDWIINPALAFYFKELYGVVLNYTSGINDNELIKEFSEQILSSIEGLIITKDEPGALNWNVKGDFGLGVFNSDSYALLHDYQFFIQNNIEPEFYLEKESVGKSQNTVFIQRPDPSQLSVLDEVKKGKSLLITGPPGTGKSSVIVNVIVDALAKGERILFVSEKKTALDVVYHQLINKGLGNLCSYYHHKLSATEWNLKLKESFEFFRENNLAINESKWESIQTNIKNQCAYFKKYAQIMLEEVKGTDKSVEALIHYCDQNKNLIFNELIVELEKFNVEPKELTSAAETLKILINFIKLYPHDKKAILAIKPSFIKDQSDIEVALSNTLFNITEGVKKIITFFDGELPDLTMLKELSIVATGLYHNLNAYQKIMHSTTEKEKFLKWGHEYLANQKLLEIEKKTIGVSDGDTPTLSEIKAIKKQINTPDKWYDFIFKKKKRSILLPQLDKLPDLDSKVDYLDRLSSFLEKKLKLSEKQANLRSRYLINVSDAELEMMLAGVERMNRYHIAVEKFIKHPQPEEFLRKIKNIENYIERLYRSVLTLWGGQAMQKSLLELSFDAEKLMQQISLFEAISPVLNNCDKKQRLLFQPLVLAENISTLEVNLLYSKLRKHLQYRPLFSSYLHKDFIEKERIFNIEFNQLINNVSNYVLFNKQKEILEYLELTDQYAKKTNDTLKPLRNDLIKGKRLLFKEFSKSMRHLSPFELLQSEAALWVNRLHPVWIMNTLSVSESLPLIEDQFDWVIFDEASQIPSENAIPAIYRGKRVLIVGDEQQMPPSRYFSSQIGEETEILSLMTYFKSSLHEKILQWHYRSEHPELIAFSNKFFYNQELIPLPRIISNVGTIKNSYIKKGRFINRENEEEAKAIAQFLSNQSFKNESIAVVCFSEAQAKLVEEYLMDIENVDIMSLEQVQGEEYDHVIISLAYGKNEDGDFRYYLGPLNRADGKKRLNVLMSRAKKSMHLFHSILPEDFMSKYDNSNIEMLYQMLLFFTNRKDINYSQENYPEPIGLVDKKEGKLLFTDRFGTYRLVDENPLNTAFINNLYDSMKVKIDMDLLQKRWENISKSIKI